MVITLEKWPGYIPGHKKGEKMKVEFIAGTIAGGKRYEPGAKADIDKAEARFLINIGKAVETSAPKKAVENKEEDIEVKTRGAKK